MNTRLTTRFASFSAACAVTLAILMGLNGMATTPLAADSLMAKAVAVKAV